MSNCVNCGAPLPDSHRHRTCSMCYGDPDWGTDGYLRRAMEEENMSQAEEEEWERQQEEEQEEGRWTRRLSTR